MFNDFDNFKITNTVVLNHEYLDKNLFTHLKNTVEDQNIGKCFEKYGYIIEIYNLEIISAEITMANCSNRFEVKYEIKTIFPKIGKKFESVSIINTIQQNNFCGALLNVFEIKKKNDEIVPIQIFLTNGIKKENSLIFENCKCSITCVSFPSKCLLTDIVIDYLVYANGLFRITGKHIH
jgi:hypothetical protein